MTLSPEDRAQLFSFEPSRRRAGVASAPPPPAPPGPPGLPGPPPEIAPAPAGALPTPPASGPPAPPAESAAGNGGSTKADPKTLTAKATGPDAPTAKRQTRPDEDAGEDTDAGPSAGPDTTPNPGANPDADRSADPVGKPDAEPADTPIAVAVADDAPGRRRTLRHVPALDGLRGVAVLAVVLFHFELTVGGHLVARGGFLGVDAFFVLSGYLITGLLLDEWQDRGRIALGEFWSRRAKRLFPALAATLVLVIVFATFVAIPDVRDQLRRQLLSTLGYVANWFFVVSGESYVEQFAFPSPLRHMWSLAIEEQFYVIWPLVVAGVLRWKQRARAVMWTALIASVLSAVWMAALFIPDTDPSRIYYGTDTRLQSLALGAALAAALAEGINLHTLAAKKWSAWAAIGVSAVLAVAWARTDYPSGWLYTGGFLLLALSVCLIILVCVDGPEPGWGNPVAAVLGWAPLRGLGLISYGVYLYHFPIFVYLDAQRTGLGGFSLFLLRVAATLGLALPSYFLLEMPIRRGDLLQRMRFRPVFLAPLVLVLFSGIMLSTMDARATLLFGEERGADLLNRPKPATGAAPGGGSAAKVMFVGDSVTHSLSSGFPSDSELNRKVAVWNLAKYFCEFSPGPRRRMNDQVRPRSTECDGWEAEWTAGKADFEPDLVLLGVGPWELFDRQIDGQWVTYGTEPFDAMFSSFLQHFIDTMADDRTKVVLITSPYLRRPNPEESEPEWGKGQEDRIDHLNGLLKAAVAANPSRAALIDFGAHLCPSHDECTESIDGVTLRPDGVHYSLETVSATKVAPWIADQLAAIARGESPAGDSASSSPTTPPGTTAGGS